MMKQLMDHQRSEIYALIEQHTAALVRGTPSRDEDQRVRGIITGLERAASVINDTEDRLRKSGALDD